MLRMALRMNCAVCVFLFIFDRVINLLALSARFLVLRGETNCFMRLNQEFILVKLLVSLG